MITFSVIGIVVMRVAHFVDSRHLFHLTIGTYHRPVVEEKVLMFLDINGSTALAARLGAFETKSLVGKFLFDISAPITNIGGEIYLYKGDGLIALWDWDEALPAKDPAARSTGVRGGRGRDVPPISTVRVVPAFRIGVHVGEVVVSEQGDIKRAIGIYGDTINIAERMEEAAKAHGVACVISSDEAQALPELPARPVPIGHETVRGVAIEVPIFEYRVAYEAAAPAGARVRPVAESEAAQLLTRCAGAGVAQRGDQKNSGRHDKRRGRATIPP